MVIDATTPLMVTSALLSAAMIGRWAIDRALSGRAKPRRHRTGPAAVPPAAMRLCRRVELFDDDVAVPA